MMRFILIVSVFFATQTAAGTVDEPTAKLIIQKGEIVSSRTFSQPSIGWEMIIRFEEGLYICSVQRDTRFGMNGSPHVEYVRVNTCIDEALE
ncbi:hypothetical protein [Yoonia sp. MH D7]